MEIRQLEGTNDVRALVRINAVAWREAYDEILSEAVLEQLDPDPSDERVRRTLEPLYDDRDGILLAEDDGTVCGYAYFRWGEGTKSFVGENEAGLKEIYVDPDYWREGIGTALLERGLALLPDSIERVSLEMLDGNDVGHRFYASHGFERTGSSTFELGGETHPTVVYTLEL